MVEYVSKIIFQEKRSCEFHILENMSEFHWEIVSILLDTHDNLCVATARLASILYSSDHNMFSSLHISIANFTGIQWLSRGG